MPPKPPPLPEILARVDALGRAPGVAGIPGAKLPPVRLPSALPKRPEQTQVGAAGPPAAGSAPSPPDVAPVSATLESNDAQVVARERLPQGQVARSVSPVPWDPRASSPELRREAERMGDELRPAPTSTVTPLPGGRTGRIDSSPPFSVSEKGVRVTWGQLRKLAPWLILGTTGFGGSVLWDQIRTSLGLATAVSVTAEQEARKDLAAKVERDAEAIALERKRVDAIACRLQRQCAALDRLGYRVSPDCQGIDWLSVRIEGDTPRPGPAWIAQGECPELTPAKP